MVAINYSADVDHIDQAVQDAELERPGQPIRLRIQPTIFRREAGKDGQHKSWPDVSWTIECENAKEAIAVREALRQFFESVGVLTPAKVRKLLKDATNEQ